MAAKLNLKSEDEKIVDQWLEEFDKKYFGELDARIAEEKAAREKAKAEAERKAEEERKTAVIQAPPKAPVVTTAPAVTEPLNTRQPVVDTLEAAKKAYDQKKAALDADFAELNKSVKEAMLNNRKADFSAQPALLERKAVLEKEKARIQREEWLRTDQKLRFMASGIGTEDDFLRIWETKLRDECLVALANGTYKYLGHDHPVWKD